MRKPIRGYEGLYVADECGDIYSLDRFDGRIWRKGRKLKADMNSAGYLRVTLSKGGKVQRFFVHRLVFETFKGSIPKGLQIHHINEDKTDNSIKNLMTATARENNHFSADAKGYKLTQEDVDYIRSTGMTTRQVADRYGISLRHALRVIKNERWVS